MYTPQRLRQQQNVLHVPLQQGTTLAQALVLQSSQILSAASQVPSVLPWEVSSPRIASPVASVPPVGPLVLEHEGINGVARVEDG